MIVGRKGAQPFPIKDITVSSKHIELKLLPDGKVQVEDLGSANGTFIDDVRIVKKIVDADTIVRLGNNFMFKISEALPSVTIDDVKKPDVDIDNQIISEFKKLENVWDRYQSDKIKLQKDNAAKGFIRMLPMFILGLLGYLISCVPELTSYRFPIVLLGIAIGVIITWISFKSATSLPEKMEKLNQQFQIDYVCPKCKQFLGFVPFQGLVNRGKCSVCKSQWV